MEAKIMELMEEDGFVNPTKGAKKTEGVFKEKEMSYAI